MAITLYVDEETNHLLKSAKEQEERFNVSAFLKNSLLKKMQSGRPNLDICNGKIEEINLDIERRNKELNYWKERLTVAQELDQKDSKLLEDAKKLEAERIIKEEERKIARLKIFKDETGKQMTDKQYLEFEDLYKKNRLVGGIIEYAQRFTKRGDADE